MSFYTSRHGRITFLVATAALAPLACGVAPSRLTPPQGAGSRDAGAAIAPSSPGSVLGTVVLSRAAGSSSMTGLAVGPKGDIVVAGTIGTQLNLEGGRNLVPSLEGEVVENLRGRDALVWHMDDRLETRKPTSALSALRIDAIASARDGVVVAGALGETVTLVMLGASEVKRTWQVGPQRGARVIGLGVSSRGTTLLAGSSRTMTCQDEDPHAAAAGAVDVAARMCFLHEEPFVSALDGKGHDVFFRKLDARGAEAVAFAVAPSGASVVAGFLRGSGPHRTAYAVGLDESGVQTWIAEWREIPRSMHDSTADEDQPSTYRETRSITSAASDKEGNFIIAGEIGEGILAFGDAHRIESRKFKAWIVKLAPSGNVSGAVRPYVAVSATTEVFVAMRQDDNFVVTRLAP
jgi:hypothetical protein